MVERQEDEDKIDINDLLRRIKMSDKNAVHYQISPDPEIAKAMRYLAEQKDEEGFKKITVAHLDLLQRINANYTIKEQVRPQSLAFIAFMAEVGDAGYMDEGVPIVIPHGRGNITQDMFEKFYGLELNNKDFPQKQLILFQES